MNFEEFLIENQTPVKHTVPSILKKHGTHVRSYGASSLGMESMKNKLAHEHSIDHKHKDEVEAHLQKKGYTQPFANIHIHPEKKHAISLSYRNVGKRYEDPAQHKIKHDEGEKWR